MTGMTTRRRRSSARFARYRRTGQKLLDIQMLTMHTGRERTRAAYAKHLAEEIFRVERVVETRSDVQILEAIPV